MFRPLTGSWYIQNSTTGFYGAAFGSSTDRIVPADYDGDGKTDIAVYRDGNWYILKSGSNTFYGVAFGSRTDIPTPADFSGDGKSEVAVYRPTAGSWYSLDIATEVFSAVQFGSREDKPVVGDYDGDGKADFAVYRPSTGSWYIQKSTSGFFGESFGISTDKPVQADYDGDGITDLAVFRDGNWYMLKSKTSEFFGMTFGSPTDIPAPADYDGDGKIDIAVYRPSEGTWYQLKSKEGFGSFSFGTETDIPTPGSQSERPTPGEGTIVSNFVLSAPDFFENVHTSVNAARLVEVNSLSFTRFITSATLMTVKGYSNQPNAVYANLGLLINGEPQEVLAFTGPGDNTLVISLPDDANKVVDIVSGLQGLSGSVRVGTYIKEVGFNSAAHKVAPSYAGRIVVYGDSISVGGDIIDRRQRRLDSQASLPAFKLGAGRRLRQQNLSSRRRADARRLYRRG